MPNAAPQLKKGLKELQEELSQTKHTNLLSYSKFTEDVIKSMGSLSYVIYIIRNDDYFILPDKPSISHREKINDYFNPDIKEIAMVGIPLSSKIFLHIESKKLRNIETFVIEITDNNSNLVNDINRSLFDNCDKQITCESEEYLQNFIKNTIHNK